MVFPVTEIIVLVLAIIVALVLYKVLKTATSLAINAVLGIIILIAAKSFFGIQVVITWLAIVICAIGGIFGALLVILLNYLKLGFT